MRRVDERLCIKTQRISKLGAFWNSERASLGPAIIGLDSHPLRFIPAAVTIAILHTYTNIKELQIRTDSLQTSPNSKKKKKSQWPVDLPVWSPLVLRCPAHFQLGRVSCAVMQAHSYFFIPFSAFLGVFIPASGCLQLTAPPQLLKFLSHHHRVRSGSDGCSCCSLARTLESPSHPEPVCLVITSHYHAEIH